MDIIFTSISRISYENGEFPHGGIKVFLAVVLFYFDVNALRIRNIRRDGFSPKAKAAKVDSSSFSWIRPRLDKSSKAEVGMRPHGPILGVILHALALQ